MGDKTLFASMMVWFTDFAQNTTEVNMKNRIMSTCGWLAPFVIKDFGTRIRHLRHVKVIASHRIRWDPITYPCLRYFLLHGTNVPNGINHWEEVKHFLGTLSARSQYTTCSVNNVLSRHGDWNHRHIGCLFMLITKKTLRLCITGPLGGESADDRWIPLTKGQWCGMRFIWWRHHNKASFPCRPSPQSSHQRWGNPHVNVAQTRDTVRRSIWFRKFCGDHRGQLPPYHSRLAQHNYAPVSAFYRTSRLAKATWHV